MYKIYFLFPKKKKEKKRKEIFDWILFIRIVNFLLIEVNALIDDARLH